jgi:hypothetical protein
MITKRRYEAVKKNILVFLISSLLVGCGIKGDKGDPGLSITGPRGDDGLPGMSCTVHAIPGGSAISCEDGTSTTVLDGTNGINATPVTAIALCPNITGGVFQEYLIKIGSDLFGIYVHGQAIGFTKLWEGNWETTDGRHCQFTITLDGEVQ